MQTRVSTLQGPALGSRVERARAPAGRREEGPREEELGPAAPRSPGGTRTGGASPPPPQLSGTTRPGPRLEPLPPALPTPLSPSPSLKGKTRSGDQALRRADVPQLVSCPKSSTHCLPGLLPGWGGAQGRVHPLGPRDGLAAGHLEGAGSQALQEPAGGGRGARGRLRSGVGRPRQGDEGGGGRRKRAGEKRKRKVAGGRVTGPRPRPPRELAPRWSPSRRSPGRRLVWRREGGGSSRRSAGSTPRLWTSNLRNQALGESPFRSAHRKPCLGEVGRFARAGWSPRGTAA